MLPVLTKRNILPAITIVVMTVFLSACHGTMHKSNLMADNCTIRYSATYGIFANSTAKNIKVPINITYTGNAGYCKGA